MIGNEDRKWVYIYDEGDVRFVGMVPLDVFQGIVSELIRYREVRDIAENIRQLDSDKKDHDEIDSYSIWVAKNAIRKPVTVFSKSTRQHLAHGFHPNFHQRYNIEIERFMRGENVSNFDGAKGHIWICEHSPCTDSKKYGYTCETKWDTLTVEPPEGGQYEIAVRFRGYNGEWSGYFVSPDGFFYSENTAGH